MNQLYKEKLVTIFRETGSILKEDPAEGTGQLRNLQKQLEGYEKSNEIKEIRFLAFALGLLIDDIFYNLTGDFPFDKKWGLEAYKRRMLFLSEMGQSFEEMADKIIEDNFYNCVDKYKDIIIGYLDTIDDLNKITYDVNL